MRKKWFKILVVSLFLISLLSVGVIAAENILDNALKPFKNIDIGATYEEYFYVIDFVLFLMFFLGVSRFALEKKFGENKGGMWVVRVLGIMLAIGVAVAETKYEFNLGTLNPLWLGIFFAIIIFMIYQLFKGIGISGGKLGTGIIFLVVYYLVYGVSPKFGEALTKMPVIGPWIAIIMAFLLIAGIILLIIGVLGLFKLKKPSLGQVDKTLGTPIGGFLKDKFPKSSKALKDRYDKLAKRKKKEEDLDRLAVSDEEKLKKLGEEEQEVGKKIDQIDDIEKQQVDEAMEEGESLKDLIARGDPLALQKRTELLKRRIEYLKNIGEIKKKVERKEEAIEEQERKIRKIKSKIQRKEKRYEKKDFINIQELIKSTIDPNEKAKLENLRNQIVKEIYGNNTLRRLLKEERKIEEEKRKLEKEAIKAGEEKEESLKEAEKSLTGHQLTVKAADEFRKKILEAQYKLAQEEEMRKRIKELESKEGFLMGAEEKIELTDLERKMSEREQMKKT